MTPRRHDHSPRPRARDSGCVGRSVGAVTGNGIPRPCECPDPCRRCAPSGEKRARAPPTTAQRPCVAPIRALPRQTQNAIGAVGSPTSFPGLFNKSRVTASRHTTLRVLSAYGTAQNPMRTSGSTPDSRETSPPGPSTPPWCGNSTRSAQSQPRRLAGKLGAGKFPAPNLWAL